MAKTIDSNNNPLVRFEATSEEHLQLVVNLVEQRVRELDAEFFDENPSEKEEQEHAALFNFLCDMEVKGYEI